MTEAEWLECADPQPMLNFLPDAGRADERKLRLFAVACCRHLLRKVRVTPHAEEAVNLAERYADGGASAAELQTARWVTYSTAEHACYNAAEPDGGVVMADAAACNAAWAATEHGASPPDNNGLSPVFNARLAVEQSLQCDIVRDIFGNPFCPVAFDPSWRTSTVTELVRGIYDGRAFDRLPILADALQDAGCDDPDILGHCRGPGPHVRGCWVVDLVLGQS
jgi:hypothetical protein